MTIASTNVKMSDISAEKGIGNANLSLKTLSGKEVKNNVSTGAQTSTFGLQSSVETYGGPGGQRNAADTIVTSAQGVGPAGLNTPPYSLSEWVGYNPVGFSRYGHNGVPVANSFKHSSTDGCFALSIARLSCYCYIVNTNQVQVSVSKWPGTSGNAYGLTKVYKHDTGFAYLSGNPTSAVQHYPQSSGGVTKKITGCTMSYTVGTNTHSGGYFSSGASVATVTGGATSTTNLGSTKIGYNLQVGGTAERSGGSGTGSAQFRVGVRFNWTFEDSPSGDTYEPSYTEIWCHLEAQAQFTGNGPGC